jgi:hypothetical protein
MVIGMDWKMIVNNPYFIVAILVGIGCLLLLWAVLH